ncbi:hypothetical protein [Parvularcula sp. IMCC14364]|nr:hypothetical protein [Parvularcula sp. IMCC14364]
MSNKQNTKFAGFGQFVNITASVAVVALIALGYASAISDLPVTI